MDLAQELGSDVSSSYHDRPAERGTLPITSSRMRFDVLVRRVGGIDVADQRVFDNSPNWRAQAALVFVMDRDSGLVASFDAAIAKVVTRPAPDADHETLKAARRVVYSNFLRARRKAIDRALAELKFLVQKRPASTTSGYDLRISRPLPVKVPSGLAKVQLMPRHFGTDLWGFMNDAERETENAKFGIADDIRDLIHESIETHGQEDPAVLELLWVSELVGEQVRSHNARIAGAFWPRYVETADIPVPAAPYPGVTQA